MTPQTRLATLRGRIPARALALVFLTIATAAAAAAPKTPQSGPALPRGIELAITSGDPMALADPSLPRLAALDSSQRVSLASHLAAWSVPRRVAAYVFLQVGTPYRIGALGEAQAPDEDPVIRFDSTDCAVLNLTAVALAHASDAGDERSAMAIANYRNAHIDFADRLHFTTDRLDASPYWKDVTRAIAGPLARQSVVQLNRRRDGSRWVPIPWSRARTVTWVPRSTAAKFAHWADTGRFPEALGVAFVRRSRLTDGLDVVHESMLWRGRTLLHASSLSGRVVLLPLRDYLAGPGREHDGFVLFEYR